MVRGLLSALKVLLRWDYRGATLRKLYRFVVRARNEYRGLCRLLRNNYIVTFAVSSSFETPPDDLLKLELLFHLKVVKLEPTLIRDDLSDSASVGLPLFLLTLQPVVLPKVLVWLKHRHFVHSDCRCNTLQNQNQPDMVVCRVTMLEAAPQTAILEAVGLHGKQRCEGTLLKIDQTVAVGRRTLWENRDRDRFALGRQLLSLLQLIKNLRLVLAVSPGHKKAL